MAFEFSDIKAAVIEKGDGRTFTDAQLARWANLIRKSVAMGWTSSGFNYYYFLYKEATVVGGSVADQGNYAQPSDFVTDLNIWYDNNLLLKAPPGVVNITQDLTATGTPSWVKMAGLEFQLIPIPDTDGNEIKLIYGAVPEEIESSDNDDFSDYFLTHFPQLHINGMAQHAAESIGQEKIADRYEQKFDKEVALLGLQNRRHWLANTRVRFQNWDEFQDEKTILFPQFQES